MSNRVPASSFFSLLYSGRKECWKASNKMILRSFKRATLTVYIMCTCSIQVY